MDSVKTVLSTRGVSTVQSHVKNQYVKIDTSLPRKDYASFAQILRSHLQTDIAVSCLNVKSVKKYFLTDHVSHVQTTKELSVTSTNVSSHSVRREKGCSRMELVRNVVLLSWHQEMANLVSFQNVMLDRR
jgi:hypothetical protein